MPKKANPLIIKQAQLLRKTVNTGFPPKKNARTTCPTTRPTTCQWRQAKVLGCAIEAQGAFQKFFKVDLRDATRADGTDWMRSCDGWRLRFFRPDTFRKTSRHVWFIWDGGFGFWWRGIGVTVFWGPACGPMSCIYLLHFLSFLMQQGVYKRWVSF